MTLLGRLLPEFGRDTTSRLSDQDFLADVDEQLESNGFAVLRSVLRKADVETICGAATKFYEHAEKDADIKYPRIYSYYAPNLAVSMVALDDYGATDYLLLRSVANSKAASCLRQYLGDDVLCSLTHSRMRKVYPTESGKRSPSTTSWHTDGSPDIGYYGTYVLWVPFTPCNPGYTGIEVKTRSGQCITPDLKQGDALLFDGKLEHRTAICPTAKHVRYSCDMRFFRPSDMPARTHPKISQDALLSVRSFAETPW